MADPDKFTVTETKRNIISEEFEDLRDERTSGTQEKKEKSRKPFGGIKLPGGMDRNSLIGIAVLLLCVILSLISIISVNSLKAKVDDINASFTAEMQTIKQTNAEMLSHMAALEQTLNTTQSTISGAASSKYIKITKQPSSTATYIGRDQAMIFQVTAEGKDLKLTWQKYDEVSGEWINLVFDLDGFNDDMGIRLYDDPANGKSELWTKGLTMKAFGTYRCVISDSLGAEVKTDSVQITEKAAE